MCCTRYGCARHVLAMSSIGKPCDSLLLLLLLLPPLLPAAREDAWVMFIEAAFAMLYSGNTDQLSMDSYQSLQGGPPARALLSLTGENTVNFFAPSLFTLNFTLRLVNWELTACILTETQCAL
jgi:hypothetical protein